MAMHQQIEEFLAAVDADKEVWGCLEVRLLAFRIEGRWHNRYTRIWLRSSGSAQSGTVLIDKEPLWAQQLVLPLGALGEILAAIHQGLWQVEGRPIHYLEAPFGPNPRPHDRWQTFSYSAGQRHNDWHRQDACRVLTSHGESGSSIYGRIPGGWHALDKLAPTLKPRPFQHLAELVGTVLGQPPVPVDGQCSIEIIAPYGVQFTPDSLRWVDGKVHGALLATASSAANLAQIAAFSGDPASRASLVVLESPWEETSAGSLSRRFTIEPGDETSVAVVLRCGETVVAHSTVYRPTVGPLNPSQMVYRLIDPTLAILAGSLNPAIEPAPGRSNKKRRMAQVSADNFAAAVGRLFTLGGWQVDVLQRGETSDFVDAVAFHPSERVCLVIECTVTAPTKEGKLSNLATRRNRVEKQLGPSWEVVALLATPVEADGVAEADRNAAGANGSVLLDGEGLTSLLELVREGAGPTRMLEELRGRLPRRDRWGLA